MKINTKATGVELGGALSKYLEEKLTAVERFLDHEADQALMTIELGRVSQHHRHGEVFRAEANLTLSGRTLRAVSEAEDLYAALDLMKDELIREVTSYRRKRLTRFRRGGRAIKNFLRGL